MKSRILKTHALDRFAKVDGIVMLIRQKVAAQVERYGAHEEDMHVRLFVVHSWATSPKQGIRPILEITR